VKGELALAFDSGRRKKGGKGRKGGSQGVC